MSLNPKNTELEEDIQKDNVGTEPAVVEEAEDLSAELKRRRRKIILAFLVIIILIILLLSKCSHDGESGIKLPTIFGTEQDANVEEGGIEKRSQEEIIAELNQKVADGMINISMNTNPVFKSGTSEGNLLIVNEKVNKQPQIVEIYLSETDELVYRSGMIPVGSKVENDKLDVDLPMGIHDCYAVFHRVDPETGESLGKASALIKLYVQS